MSWPWKAKREPESFRLPPYDPVTGKIRVGIYEDGTVAEISIANHSGGVIGGVPGSGKTVGMMTIVLCLLLAGCDVVIIDGKGGLDWRWARPYISAFADDDLDLVHDIVTRIWRDMRRRLRDADYGNPRIVNYWDAPPEDRPPLKVIVIDECQSFFDTKSVLGGNEAVRKAQEILAMVTDIVKKGRSAGFIVFVITQKPTADSIPTSLRGNADIKVCFRVTTQEAAKAVLGPQPADAPSPLDIPPTRRGGAVLIGEDGLPRMCRFAHITVADAEHAAAAKASRIAPPDDRT